MSNLIWVNEKNEVVNDETILKQLEQEYNINPKSRVFLLRDVSGHFKKISVGKHIVNELKCKNFGNEIRSITHREYEEKYLGGDTRKRR